MENFPQSVNINMQPYSSNRAGSPTTPFVPTATSFDQPPPIPSPPDFVLWSFFSTLFCNPFCLGFIALIFSIKARDRKIALDPEGASSYGRTARYLNIAALCLGILVAVICVVLLTMYYNVLQGPHV